MILRLIREPSKEGATLGSLYLNGEWMCWTLEDAIREVANKPVAEWKIPGETAIPAGTYSLAMSKSPRLRIVTPELIAVPGYTGVRIHVANSANDIEGCIGVGRTRSKAWIGESKLAFADLMRCLDGVPFARLRIENPVTE